MKCAKFQERISEALDGRLEGADREAFDAHEADCPACAEAKASLAREERAAKKSSEIMPAPRFEEKVISRIEAVPPTLQEGLTARPASRWFRTGVGVAAGLLIGALLGALGHMSLRDGAPDASPAAPGPIELVTRELDQTPDPKELDKARSELGNFLDASELMAGNINSRPWEEPLCDMGILSKIVQGIDMEKRLERVEEAKPILRKIQPESDTPLGHLMSEQAEILDHLSGKPMLTGDDVEEVQARAFTSLEHIRKVRKYFPRKRKLRLPPNVRLEIRAPFLNGMTTKEDVDILIQAQVKEIEGDLKGALEFYRVLKDKYPSSTLNLVGVPRQIKFYKDAGRDDEAVQVIKSYQKQLRKTQINCILNAQFHQILNELQTSNPNKGEEIKEIRKVLINVANAFFTSRLREIRRVEIDGVPVDVDKKNFHAARSLYMQLVRGWDRSSRTVAADNEHFILIEYQRPANPKATRKHVHYYLKKLGAGKGALAPAEKVQKIIFMGR